MDCQGIDQNGPSGSTSGIVAEDIAWAFGISVAVLGLVPLMAIYVLLVA
jgi:hypothetical protein